MNCSLAEEPWEKIAQLGYNNLNSGSPVEQCHAMLLSWSLTYYG
jgi:hypothetical protein